MVLRLKRELGLLEATIFGIAIIIGAGIYALIGIAAGHAGSAVWLSFVIGAVVAVFTGLSYAELSSMFPKAGAEYVYVRRAYGSEFLAFLLGWLIIFTGILSASTVSIAFANYLHALLQTPIIPFAIFLIAGLAVLNYIGIKETSKVNIIFAAVEILGLIIVIILGMGNFGKVDYFETPNGLTGVFVAAALIFFAYLGFEEVVNVAEETKNPKRIIPRALVLSVVISTVLYILASLSAVSLVHWSELSRSEAPLAFAVSHSILGQNGFFLISIVALFATITTVLGILLVTSRMVYGMANEKSLPKILASLDKKTKTPHVAIIAVSVLSVVFLFYGGLEKLAEITSLGALATFTAINLALIWLRYTKPKMKRPFKTPLNIGRYPVLAFLGVFSTLFMIFQFELNLIGFIFIVLAIGTVIYVLHKKGYIGEIVKDATGVDIEKK